MSEEEMVKVDAHSHLTLGLGFTRFLHSLHRALRLGTEPSPTASRSTTLRSVRSLQSRPLRGE